jgi:putative ABC transport system ATP-binding protein
MAKGRKIKEPVLKLVNANKSWVIGENTIPVLRNIDLDIFPGESLAIMGPSGSGKSTLLHVLGLLTSIDNGDLLFKGKSVRSPGIKDKTIRRHFGFIFQDAKLIPELNVIDNICVPLMHRGIWPVEQKKRALEILNKIGLGERVYHFPNQLSGGEIMRTAVARAMILEPTVLLADEPTGSLDSQTGKRISDLLLGMVTPDMALVIVTHHQPLADCADRILYMKDGRLGDSHQGGSFRESRPPGPPAKAFDNVHKRSLIKSFLGVQEALNGRPCQGLFQKSPLAAGGNK